VEIEIAISSTNGEDLHPTLMPFVLPPVNFHPLETL